MQFRSRFGSNDHVPPLAATNGRSPSNHGLLLGRETADTQEPSDLSTRFAPPQYEARPVTYHGDGHLLTCAITGMGKGRGVLIPNALLYPGPLIAVDPKGELFQTTARQRQRLGQHVVALDPFTIDDAHIRHPLPLA
jgi:type IV secretion system protein VirD4